MRVRMLTNLGTNDYADAAPFIDGSEHDVNDELGRKWVACGWANDVTPPPPDTEPVKTETKPATKPSK